MTLLINVVTHSRQFDAHRSGGNPAPESRPNPYNIARVQVINVCRTQLGSFTPSGRIAVARVGARLMGKREILASRLLQKVSFSPAVVKRHSSTYEEHHHDDRD